MSIEDQNRPEPTDTGLAQVAPGASDSGQSVQTEPKQSAQSEPASSTQTQAEETFYADFHSLPPEKQEELLPYYKQMQGAFTKKAQALAKQRQEHSQKVQAYDQFVSNPVENIMRMAQQYGLHLTPAQAQQVANQQQQPVVQNDWTPGTWEEVFNKSGEYIRPTVENLLREQLTPYQEKIAAMERELSEVRASKVQKQLNEIDPNWQMYEDEMRQVLERYPQLANDIPALYKLAVPQEVLESKATQTALKKYDAKIQAAKVESSGHSKQSGPAKVKYATFEEAFQAAKRDIGRK